MSFYMTPRQSPAAGLCRHCRSALVATRSPLTERQADLLHFIREYIGLHGYAPSFEDIADAFGYRSLATVHEHLSNLERKGYLVRRYNESRSIALVDEPAPAISARLAELSRICEAYRVDSGKEEFDDAVMEGFLTAFDTDTVGWLIALAARGASVAPEVVGAA